MTMEELTEIGAVLGCGRTTLARLLKKRRQQVDQWFRGDQRVPEDDAASLREMRLLVQTVTEAATHQAFASIPDPLPPEPVIENEEGGSFIPEPLYKPTETPTNLDHGRGETPARDPVLYWTAAGLVMFLGVSLVMVCACMPWDELEWPNAALGLITTSALFAAVSPVLLALIDWYRGKAVRLDPTDDCGTLAL